MTVARSLAQSNSLLVVVFGFPLSISSISFSICAVGLRYLGYTAIWLACLALFDSLPVHFFSTSLSFSLYFWWKNSNLRCREREKDPKKCYCDNVVQTRAHTPEPQQVRARSKCNAYLLQIFRLHTVCVCVCLFVEMERKRIEFITSVQYFDSKCMFHKMVNGFAQCFFFSSIIIFLEMKL